MNSEITITVKGNEYLIECEKFFIKINKKCSKCNSEMSIWGITEVFDVINTSTENHLNPKSPLARHIIKIYNKKQEKEKFFCLVCNAPRNKEEIELLY